ncbi:MAG: 4a-hydroxytetrahydrobiopterin dehydratase [Candidatus Moraniibacteriota bacterium]
MDLNNKKCVPCEGGVDPLSSEVIATYLAVVEGWTNEADKKIHKDYVFKDFAEALTFVNQVGAIAEAEGHHPDILLHGWKEVRLTLFTHAIQGLHLNDFVLASKIDAMWKKDFEKSV